MIGNGKHVYFRIFNFKTKIQREYINVKKNE